MAKVVSFTKVQPLMRQIIRINISLQVNSICPTCYTGVLCQCLTRHYGPKRGDTIDIMTRLSGKASALRISSNIFLSLYNSALKQ